MSQNDDWRLRVLTDMCLGGANLSAGYAPRGLFGS